MDEKELQEFSLEDILKEFGDPRPEPEEPEVELVEEEPEAPEVPETPVNMEQTIRLDTTAFTHGQVRNAEKIDDEAEQDVQEMPVQPEEKEAFTEDWEPEYEQPIAEYIPPPPIIFHPRSRLRELKKQLIAGPEKQYYALSEKGLGKIQAAIFFSVLVVLISAIATAMYAFGAVEPDRMRLMVFSQFFAMLLSALLGSFQLIDGISDLFRGKFSLNTLLVFTFILCCVDGVLCLQQLRVPCCAAFSLQMCMSLWSSYHRRNTQLGQLDTMRKAIRLDGIYARENFFDGKPGLLRDEGQVADFMDTYDREAKPEKILNIYSMCALAASVVIGIVAGVLHGFSLGIQVTAVSLLAATPATIFITLSRPMAVLCRRLHALGTVLCGWHGIDALRKKVIFPLRREDLFPNGTVKLNGVKFYSGRESDQVIAYATALVGAQDSSLAPLFNHLLDSRNGAHYTAVNLRAYENGGIGGEVNGEPVLVGTFAFLGEMGVELPQGIRVGQAVCVAIDGELCGLFAITYEKDRAAAAGLTTLCAYRGLRPMLLTEDFMITPEFVKNRFSVNPKRLIIPDGVACEELSQKTRTDESYALAMTTQEGLAPFAYGVTGARAVWSASITGIVVHMVGGILGLLMMLALAILGAKELLTPGNLFLYELIWMIPGFLITEWTRSV